MALEWRCFHCDEVFTDEAEARNHFGLERDYSTPACRLSVDDVRQLRELEQTNAELRAENERLDNDARLWHEADADRRRRIGDRQWWQEIDYREGEKLVLQRRVRELERGVRDLCRWTRHHSKCARVTDADDCSCGLNDALVRLRPKGGE